MKSCDLKLVKFFLYCCSLTYKRDYLYSICIYLHLLLIKSKLKETFLIESAPYELLLKLVKDRRKDLNNCILINDKYHKHILNNVILINIHDINEELNFRTAQIIPTNKISLNSNKIIVPYELYHNLKSKNNIIQLGFTNYNTQQIAAEIEISLISSPFDFNNAIVDEIIKSYFKSPKILYKNDTICINLKQYVPHLMVTNLKLSQINNAYFICKNISTKSVSDCKYGYFAVIGETAIKQSVTMQDRIISKPNIIKQCKEICVLEDLIISPYPEGLHKYFVELESAVKPFFDKNLKVHPLFLIQGCKGSGKKILVEAVANKLGINLFAVPAGELVGNNYMQTEIRLKNCFFRLQMCSPSILHLLNFEQFGKNNEGEYDSRIINYFSEQLIDIFNSNSNQIVIICSSNTKSVHSDLARMFLDTVTIEAADLHERHDILRWLANKDDIHVDSDTLRAIALKTNGFYYEDFNSLLYHAMHIRFKKNGFLFDAKVEREYLEDALDLMQSAYNESIGAPKVPKVHWSDIGGLNNVKDEIIKTINLPLKHPEFLKTTGLKRSGILLFGPPGTGKTLMAKAVATECSLCFLSVKGPELLNMYIGQSEQNVREVFQRAREASPCIIFFDELDALAPNRGISGDSGGVMDRIVSQLLSEMDGINDSGLVFIIGATNRPDLIDAALLRPGRFDKLLYVGPCEDVDSKLSVLRALTRKFSLNPGLDLSAVISACGGNLTGADMYGICSGAWLNAAKRIISTFESDNLIIPENAEVLVNFDDFQMAISHAKPSVNEKDMEYFNKLKSDLGATK